MGKSFARSVTGCQQTAVAQSTGELDEFIDTQGLATALRIDIAGAQEIIDVIATAL
jgi:hypothetical protein